jgi:hypothetical protein
MIPGFQIVGGDGFAADSEGGGGFSVLDYSPLAWYQVKDTNTLDLDGTAVINVADKSTNSRDISQPSSGSRPTYDSANECIHFNGTYLYNTSPFMYSNAPIEIFTVLKPDAVVSGEQFLLSEGSSTSSQPIYSPTIKAKTWPYDSMEYYLRYDSGTFVSIQRSELKYPAFIATRYEINYVSDTGSSATGGVDGELGTPLFYSRGSETFTADRFAIGGLLRSSFALPMNFYFKEMIVLGGTASESRREEIEGYLAHEHGLESYLPSDHTYKSNPPS